MISTVKNDQLKKSFDECGVDLDAARVLEKGRETANGPRQKSQPLESSMADWLTRAGARRTLEHGVAPRLLQRTIKRRPRAPIEDEPEREAL
jgi:hypothetical protein